jgi:hypothetical protein
MSRHNTDDKDNASTTSTGWWCVHSPIPGMVHSEADSSDTVTSITSHVDRYFREHHPQLSQTKRHILKFKESIAHPSSTTIIEGGAIEKWFRGQIETDIRMGNVIGTTVTEQEARAVFSTICAPIMEEYINIYGSVRATSKRKSVCIDLIEGWVSRKKRDAVSR